MTVRYLALLALAAQAGACGSSDGVCGQIYDKQRACWEKKAHDADDRDDLPTKSEFVAMCKAATRSRKEEVDIMADCSKLDDCDAIDKCMDEAHEARYQKKQLAELNEAVESADWNTAFDDCRYLPEKTSLEMMAACEKVFTEGIPVLMTGPHAEDIKSACRYSDDLKGKSAAFVKACASVAGGEYEALKKEVTAARDQGTNDYGKCYELQQLGATVSDQAKLEADQLCAEMAASETVKQALDEARAAIAAGRDELSYYCTSAASQLAAITPATTWSKQQLDQVVQTCFVDQGKVILAAELPGLSYCTFTLSQLRDAVKTYGVTGRDPAFDGDLAKTDKVCTQ